MITAALCWYDEPLGNLARLVLSLEGIASNLVALDGRWNLMPGDNTNSHDEQADEIYACCQSIGLPLALYRVERPWDSQVAKRGALMHIAARVGRQPWTLVIDADEYATSPDPQALHHHLGRSELDVATVLGRREGTGMRTGERPIRRLYRAATDVQVTVAHNGYRTADGRWLHGDSAFVNLQPAQDLHDLLTITNHVNSRSGSRNRAALDYRTARADTRIERWPRGLKR